MKLLLIDGLNLVRRIYSALPEDRRDNFTDQSRFRFVQSCTHSLARALKEHNPSHCLAVFEERQITWRHEIFPQYKNNRKPPPESLIDSLGDVEKAFKETGVSPFRLTGFEADDVIATFATGVANRNGKAVILSTDRLLCQLISSEIQIYDHFSGQVIDESKVYEKFGVGVNKIVDVMALAGDSSLSVPGIKSVGLKTAAKLIDKFGDLETILDSTSKIPGALGNNISACKIDAKIAYQIFRLKTDIPLGVNLNQFRYSADISP